MKKRIFIGLMLAALLLSGCGSKQTAPAPAEPYVPRETTATGTQSAAADFQSGSGTAEDPFQIGTPEELALLRDRILENAEIGDSKQSYSEACYILTNDIVLNDTADFDFWNQKAPQYSWTPIGQTYPGFNGTLDGNGYSIIGMFIDADAGTIEKTQDHVFGLFGKVGGTIRNLNMADCYIRVSGSYKQVGSIAGEVSLKGSVENYTSNARIEIMDGGEAGGIAGEALGDDTIIQNCIFTGSVRQLDDTSSTIGGICGNADGLVAGCINEGSLFGSDVGGICGYGHQIENCKNTGSVEGSRVGGICASIFTTTALQRTESLRVVNCMNEGAVHGGSVAGGVIGEVGYAGTSNPGNADIHNCENSGTVDGADVIGGIVGKVFVDMVDTLNLSELVNRSDLKGSTQLGGIVGKMQGGISTFSGNIVITNCRNLGNLEAEYCGGVLAYLLFSGDDLDLNLTLTGCENHGSIRSKRYSGGILGFNKVSANNNHTSSLNISDSTNSGNILGVNSNSYVGGIAANIGVLNIPVVISGCTNTGNVALDYNLTDAQRSELQGASMFSLSQICGGIVGRIGEALMLSTGNDVHNAAYINCADGRILLTDCTSTGRITAPDNSDILNKVDEPVFLDFLGGIVGEAAGSPEYTFTVRNCTYSGAPRALGDTSFPDIG